MAGFTPRRAGRLYCRCSICRSALSTCRAEDPGRPMCPSSDWTIASLAVIDEADSAGFSRFALIGHSLAGVTITETALRHPERIAQLVYVAALVPSLESSAALLMTGAEMEGTMTMSEDTARPMFGNDLTEEQWVEHAKSLVPDAIGIMNARLSGYPAGIPITYVNMTRDVPVPPALAEQMAANLGPGVQRLTIDAGHTVMVSQPKALAEIINSVTAG